MKVTVEENPGLEQTEVVIRCPRMDAEASRLVELLRLSGARLTGERDGQTCILDEDDVLYIDTVDRGTFLYTACGVYESRLRLYELEERLDLTRFVRISNSEIISLNRVTAVDLSLSGTICMTLDGAVKAYVSRRYVKKIKETLNLGRRNGHEKA